MMKKCAAAAIILAMCTLSAAQVFATTPEFGRTQEEWSGLRDNTLEYDELDDLIKEYNATVKNNVFELKDYKDTYGTTNAQVRQAYLDMAAELRAAIDYGNSDDLTYGYSASSALMNESSATSLEQQADSTLDDYETTKLGYEMAEKTLAQTAKSNMIAYYNNLLTAEKEKLNTDLMTTQLEVAKAQAGAGTATQTDIFTATEDLMNSQKELTVAEATAKAAAKKLQVMCGWGYDASPVFGTLPDLDLTAINAVNLAADTEKALQNNYTLKINERKLANAEFTSSKDKAQITVDSNKSNIKISMSNLYDTLISAKLVYDYAKMASDVQQQLLTIAERKFEVGEISKVELKAQQVSARAAGITAEQAKNSLLEAKMNYDYAVAGLASA